MGTKMNPGKFDCYAKAGFDEPMFVLLARDEHAPATIRFWIARKMDLPADDNLQVISAQGHKALPEKLCEALDCADAMVLYRIAPVILKELESLRAFKRSVDEALNSGDGTYRP